MLRVGFEPTIIVLERAKTVHALDGAATVIGTCYYYALKLIEIVSAVMDPVTALTAIMQ
jgi:hypothetical protein